MIWSETPPTESGWYWVWNRFTGRVFTWEIREKDTDTLWHASSLLFGPPIPSPEQCHEWFGWLARAEEQYASEAAKLKEIGIEFVPLDKKREEFNRLVDECRREERGE